MCSTYRPADAVPVPVPGQTKPKEAKVSTLRKVEKKGKRKSADEDDEKEEEDEYDEDGIEVEFDEEDGDEPPAKKSKGRRFVDENIQRAGLPGPAARAQPLRTHAQTWDAGAPAARYAFPVRAEARQSIKIRPAHRPPVEFVEEVPYLASPLLRRERVLLAESAVHLALPISPQQEQQLLRRGGGGLARPGSGGGRGGGPLRRPGSAQSLGRSSSGRRVPAETCATRAPARAAALTAK